MNEHQPGFDADDETRRLLHAADPAHRLQPADPARLSALLEDTMTTPDTQTDPQTDTRTGPRPARTRLLVVLGAAAAVAAVAVVGVTALSGDDDRTAPAASTTEEPSVTALHAGPAVAAKCAAPQASFVTAQQVAFRGEVVSVSDDLVTLTASEFYTGTPTDQVTVDRPDLGMSEMPVDFRVGETYLVGATDGRVSICGLSGLATPELQALYDDAFAG